MRYKILTSFILIGILSLLVGGASLAYFTSDITEDDLAKFTSATVKINVSKGKNTSLSRMEHAEDRNLEWDILNESTESVQLRAKVLESGKDVGEDIILAVSNNEWIKGQDDYYYYDDLVEPDLAVTFPLEVLFNTWNAIDDYGISIEAEAIQSTNDAMDFEW